MIKLPAIYACHLLVAVLLVLSPLESRAANHFILPSPGGVSGTTGADWAHACSDFTGNCAPGSLVRGDTYYVGGGTYAGGYSFSKANSGTSTITIMGCASTDSTCTAESGWNASYAVDSTPASFPSSANCGSYPGCRAMYFNSGYWVIDGAVHGSSSSTGYGFQFPAPTCSSSYGMNTIQFDIGGDHDTIQNAALAACSGDYPKPAIILGNTSQSAIYNDNVAYLYLTGFQDDFQIYGLNNGIIEHVYGTNHFSSGGNHGTPVDMFSWTNGIFRYNVYTQCNGTGCMETNVTGSGVSLNGAEIYGNVFAPGSGVANGVIVGSQTAIINSLVYNNTFDLTSAPVSWWWNTDSGYCNAQCQTGGNVLYNNIVWSGTCTPDGHAPTPTHDYNTYLSCSDTPPSETHGQTGSWNPFVNSGGGNYNLANAPVSNCNSTGAICGGINEGSLYTTDIVGDPYGANGQWERGAYAYLDPPGQPAPPTDLNAVVQ